MSTIIHMETEQVHGVARQLAQTAERVQQDCSSLLGQVSRIDWQSPSRDDFLLQFEQLIHNIVTTAENGILLSQRIQREAEEWQTVDGEGGSQFTGLAAVPAMAVTKAVGNFWSNIKGLFDPADFNEGTDYLLSTDAGRELIGEAEENNLGFELPDGRIIGSRDGKIIPIRFGDSGEGAVGGYNPNPDGNSKTEDPAIIISNDWLHRRFELNSRDELGNTLAHEMQHALDDRKGLSNTPAFHGSLDDEAGLESYSQRVVECQVATEVRAWERGDAVQFDRVYQDDSVISQSEAQRILAKGYEERYEKMLNDSEIGQKYTADVCVDQVGKVQVDLKPKPELIPVSFTV